MEPRPGDKIMHQHDDMPHDMAEELTVIQMVSDSVGDDYIELRDEYGDTWYGSIDDLTTGEEMGYDLMITDIYSDLE